MNNLDTKAKERSKALSKLQKKYDKIKMVIDMEIQKNDEYIEWGKEKKYDTSCIGFYNRRLKLLKKEWVK